MVNRSHESRKLTYRVDLPGGQERLKELVLYVAEKAQAMPRFGLIKLNKIIWRADFTAFAERKQPVTGRAYQRLALGPAAVEMRPLLAEMVQDGYICFQQLSFGRSQDGSEIVEYRPIAKASPSLHFFSADDMTFVDASIRYYWDLTGMETSDESHGVAWRTRKNLDPMPYESALLSDEELSDIDLDKLKRIASERGWKSA